MFAVVVALVQGDQTGARRSIEKLLELIATESALGKNWVELQHHLLDRARAHVHAALFQRVDGATQKMKRAFERCRIFRRANAFRQEVFVGNVLVAVAAHQIGGELVARDDDDVFAQELQAFDERQKVAVAGNEAKGVDVSVRGGDVEAVDDDTNVGGIFDERPECGRFDQLDALFHQLAAMAVMAIPVAVSASHDDDAARTQGVDDEFDVESRVFNA